MPQTPAQRGPRPGSKRPTTLAGYAQAELRVEMARQALTTTELATRLGPPWTARSVGTATGSYVNDRATLLLDELGQLARALGFRGSEIMRRAEDAAAASNTGPSARKAS